MGFVLSELIKSQKQDIYILQKVGYIYYKKPTSNISLPLLCHFKPLIKLFFLHSMNAQLFKNRNRQSKINNLMGFSTEVHIGSSLNVLRGEKVIHSLPLLLSWRDSLEQAIKKLYCLSQSQTRHHFFCSSVQMHSMIPHSHIALARNCFSEYLPPPHFSQPKSCEVGSYPILHGVQVNVELEKMAK